MHGRKHKIKTEFSISNTKVSGMFLLRSQIDFCYHGEYSIGDTFSPASTTDCGRNTNFSVKKHIETEMKEGTREREDRVRTWKNLHVYKIIMKFRVGLIWILQ